ncbi:MAG: hypothetical protein LBE71_01490 [Dysgonamonadaceae bacterium]|jgi:hypothetical protein|nr:hypothetical protein [Dysgonamonadaceae bacterium]
MKKLVLVFGIVVWTCCNVKAQESRLDFSVGADLVSSYVWRGAHQTKAAIQPAASLSVGGFSLSAWASTEIVGPQKEVDFTLGYSAGNLSLVITDYWWEGERNEHPDRSHGFFRPTKHLWEGSVGYVLPLKSFPLSLSANVMFAGNDDNEDNGEDVRTGDGKNDYSTYIEASFPFAIKDVSLDASLGATTHKGLYATEASVINIGLKASKEIKITDSFSLPVFGQIIANPHRHSEDIFFVFGISL